MKVWMAGFAPACAGETPAVVFAESRIAAEDGGIKSWRMCTKS